MSFNLKLKNIKYYSVNSNQQHINFYFITLQIYTKQQLQLYPISRPIQNLYGGACTINLVDDETYNLDHLRPLEDNQEMFLQPTTGNVTTIEINVMLNRGMNESCIVFLQDLVQSQKQRQNELLGVQSIYQNETSIYILANVKSTLKDHSFYRFKEFNTDIVIYKTYNNSNQQQAIINFKQIFGSFKLVDSSLFTVE